jgi:cytochrome P450
MAAVAKVGLPPHPKDKPLVGSVPDFIRDTPQTFIDGWQECGDVVRFRGIRPMVLVSHPDYVKQVLEDNYENYPRSPGVIKKLGLMGESTFNVGGEPWERQHRIVYPTLHGPHITAWGDFVVKATMEMLERWGVSAERGESVEMYGDMTRLIFDVMGWVLFGSYMHPQAANMLDTVMVGNEYAIAGVMEVGGPPDRIRPAYRRYLRSMEAVDAMIYGNIQERRREPTNDLLSMLIGARDEVTGEGLTDQLVRDEVMTTIHGAYKSLANGLSMVWYALSKHPQDAERIGAEVDGVVGDGVPSPEHLPRLPYLSLVLQEILRLYPPVWVFARTPLEDDVIGGYRIPAGMSVVLSPYVTHRHEAFWDNPEGFDPQRFTPENAAGRHPYAYFPFAGGPRRCVGEEFALMTMKLVMATIAPRFRLNLVPGTPIVRRREFVLRSIKGLHMRPEQRRQVGEQELGDLGSGEGSGPRQPSGVQGSPADAS